MTRWHITIIILVHIAWYTATHNLWGSVYIGSAISTLFFCFQQIKSTIRKRNDQTVGKIGKTLFQYMLIQGVCICVVIAMVVRYDNSMDNQIISSHHYQGIGMIVEQPKDGQYLFKDTQGKLIIINTQRAWLLGDHIGISGIAKQKPGYTHKTQETITTFDYPTRLWMKGYAGVIQVQKERAEQSIGLEEKHNTLLLIKQYIISRINDLFGRSDKAGLVRGMLIGSRAGLTDETYKSFIGSGLVHLIAVSGSNMVYVAMVLGWLLRRLPYYMRMGCIGVGLIVYAVICGGDSSVIRAVIMSIMSIVALYSGRGNSIMYTLPFVMIGMLMSNPYQLVYDLGFILSFGAVIGLVVVTQGRNLLTDAYDIAEEAQSIKRRILLNPIGSIIVPSIGATLGVLPSLMIMTGQYNITGFLINILLQPCIPFFTLGGALSMITNHFGLMGQWIIALTDWMAGQIIWLSKWTVSHGVILAAQGRGSISISVLCILFLWSGIYYISYQKKITNK